MENIAVCILKSSIMEVSRKIYIVILSSAFAYAILKSYFNLLEEHTTFEESILKNHGILPSLTLCVNQHQADNFTTMEDVSNAVELEKSRSSGFIRYIGHGLDPKKLDLKNVTVLSEHFNISYDEVWSYGVHVSSKSPFPLTLCTTLNLPFIQAPNPVADITLDIRYQPYSTSIRMEKHQPYQSLHNHEFDWLGGLELVRNATGVKEVLTTLESVLLKKESHDCYEDNSMKITNCINEVIAEKLDCSLPWMNNISSQEICTGSDKLIQFREFYSNLNSNQTQMDIKKCLKPNCKTIKWKKSYTSEWSRKKGMMIQMTLPSNSYTISRKEILLADFSTFMADFGSYLGLFLGTSVLSIIDILVNYLVCVKNALFGKATEKKSHRKSRG